MCGSSHQQNEIERSQADLFTTMKTEAQQVFGKATDLYNSLVSTFAPIFKAGPNQEGFSAPEKAALETQATEGTAANFSKASSAVRNSYAGEGGGNVYIPSGQEQQTEAEVAAAAAGEQSREQTQIAEADYATGRENWTAAAKGLMGAGDVFAPASNFGSTATGAGSAAAKTASDIAQADNAWIGSVTGMIGGVAGAAVGNPKGFFTH